MKLQKKVFWIIVLALMGLSTIMFFTSNYSTVKAFQSMERRFFQRDMQQIQSRIDEELSRLRQYASDWGAWDAMYSFIKHPEETHFSSLLNGMSLRALDVDMLIVVDQSHTVQVAYTVSELGEEIPFSKVMMKDLEQALPLFCSNGASGAVQGFAKLDGILFLCGRPYLVACSDILMTNWSGPPRGHIFVGFNMNDKLRALSSFLDVSLTLVPVEPGRYPSSQSGEITLESEPDGMTSVWQMREDLLGPNLGYAIRMKTTRDIYNEGRRVIIHSYFWIALNGIVLTLMILYFLNSMVLRRLKRMQDIAKGITDNFEISLRIPVSMNDEITSLACSFNILFATLENFLMEIPDSMFITDSSGSILLANSSALHLLGLKPDSKELRGISVFSLFPKTRDPRNMGNPTWSPESLQSVYETSLSLEGSQPVPVEIHQRPITYGRRRLILFLARDLRERKKLELRLKRKTFYDDLTGLPNRTSLIEKLTAILRAASSGEPSMAFAILNMDHFKLINAQLGNTNGDRILLIVAQRIRDLADGFFVYRTGGDEFSLLMPGLSGDEKREELTTFLSRLQTAISAPCQVGEGSVHPSASIGVISDITAPELLQNPTAIIEKAMQALKLAKRSGLGVTVFYEDEQQKHEAPHSINILAMRAEISTGLEKDEFIPNFQPIYDITDRKLSGFETLVRWQHPKKGLLFPSSFIPHAEEMGLIGDIDRCMIQHALKAVERTPSPLYFSANGSAHFLSSPNAIELLQSFLDQTEADPSRFVLEVTESVLIENLAAVSKALEHIRDKGIHIYLDDFGTGYSSLQYIHSLPLDCIKLDMEFTRRVLESEKDARMLRSIVDMANALNLDTIAEGVESESQLLWLQEAGCKKAQGYYFSKPLSWEDMEHLIEGGRSA
ncbi:MAG: EAL domain-containing protein [Fretibacterium sp.]|nr:EAL domain-containing protein [Fretibacterium sp.]